MKQNEKWLEWAIELQSLAQAGLYFGRDVYDIERFERIREISAEMISYKTEIPLETVKDLFCKEIGYQTPKLDTRAAVFQDGKILLVQEKSGEWVLPGGWVDVNKSVKENAVKEVKEEAGLDVTAEQIIAVQDRDKHNFPPYAYKICKVFVLCSLIGGEFQENSETIASGYFDFDELPELDAAKTTKDQIRMCFEANEAEYWTTIFD